MGPYAQESMRYQVVAKAGGKCASGNPAASVEAALSVVHWWDLDLE